MKSHIQRRKIFNIEKNKKYFIICIQNCGFLNYPQMNSQSNVK